MDLYPISKLLVSDAESGGATVEKEKSDYIRRSIRSGKGPTVRGFYQERAAAASAKEKLQNNTVTKTSKEASKKKRRRSRSSSSSSSSSSNVSSSVSVFFGFKHLFMDLYPISKLLLCYTV